MGRSLSDEKSLRLVSLGHSDEGAPAVLVIGAVLLAMPAIVEGFILYQTFGWSFILGMIALSLMFLAGYGGMVSLAQMTVAGMAGYMVAIFGTSAITEISQGWPWYIVIPLAVLIAVLFGTATGWLAVRTEGIYTIMITLAIAAAFFYFFVKTMSSSTDSPVSTGFFRLIFSGWIGVSRCRSTI